MANLLLGELNTKADKQTYVVKGTPGTGEGEDRLHHQRNNGESPYQAILFAVRENCFITRKQLDGAWNLETYQQSAVQQEKFEDILRNFITECDWAAKHTERCSHYGTSCW
eukprot:3153406-Amphidinium_carterae.2